MSCRNIPQRLREDIIKEANYICACAVNRHLDSVPPGGFLEIHHIHPYREVKKHDFKNLIALCPNCHRKADDGLIPIWTLEQLKAILPLRRLSKKYREERIIELLKQYANSRDTVIGEGFYTATAFFEFVRDFKMKQQDMFEFILKRISNDSLPEILIAKMYLEVDNGEKARKILMQSSLRNKPTIHYLFLLGNASLRSGHFRAALNSYEQAISYGCNSKNLFCNMGDCLIYIGQSVKSPRAKQRYYQRALEIFERTNLRDPAILFNKGRLFAIQERMEEAKACFIEAINYGRQYPLPHVFLADILFKEGDLEGSLNHYRAAIDRRPRSLQFLFRAAKVAERLKLFRDAYEFLCVYEKNNPYMPIKDRKKITTKKAYYRKELLKSGNFI